MWTHKNWLRKEDETEKNARKLQTPAVWTVMGHATESENSKYEREEGEKLWWQERPQKKLCMLAWLCVFLCGPFGGLLLIKLLLHDAPSWLDLSQGLCEAGTA